MLRLRPMNAVLLWLRPGLHLKRWLVLAGGALVLSSLGLGLILADLYRVQPFPEFVYFVTLQFVPRLARGVLLFALGIATGGFAWYQFSRSLLAAVLTVPRGPVVQVAFQRRYLQAGPRIVAIGGGTGLANLLHGLKNLTANSTAIVTVADDGGSSGRLRRDLGILPPGDFRQCIVALADAEPLMATLLQHRFRCGGSLEGHSFGNLLLTAMTEITGSFERALQESSRVLAVRGRVIPSTLANVTLCAELAEGRVLRGESQVGRGGSQIRRVFLDPASAPAYPDAVAAIMAADAVIIGPGSLFTSILPNLLVHDLARALQNTSARKIYICNVATEPGETSGFDVSDFVRVLREHVGNIDLDCVLANSNLRPVLGRSESSVELVQIGRYEALTRSAPILTADVIDDNNPTQHDPDKLVRVLAELVPVGRPSSRDGNGHGPRSAHPCAPRTPEPAHDQRIRDYLRCETALKSLLSMTVEQA